MSKSDILYAPGDIVWAKMKGYPHWPAKVLPCHNSISPSPSPRHYFVFFYGTYEVAWMASKDLLPYQKYQDKLRSSSQRVGLKAAVWEAEEDPGLELTESGRTLLDQFEGKGKKKRKQNKPKSEEDAVTKRVKSEPVSDEERQCGSSSDIEDNKMTRRLRSSTVKRSPVQSSIGIPSKKIKESPSSKTKRLSNLKQTTLRGNAKGSICLDSDQTDTGKAVDSRQPVKKPAPDNDKQEEGSIITHCYSTRHKVTLATTDSPRQSKRTAQRKTGNKKATKKIKEEPQSEEEIECGVEDKTPIEDTSKEIVQTIEENKSVVVEGDSQSDSDQQTSSITTTEDIPSQTVNNDKLIIDSIEEDCNDKGHTEKEMEPSALEEQREGDDVCTLSPQVKSVPENKDLGISEHRNDNTEATSSTTNPDQCVPTFMESPAQPSKKQGEVNNDNKEADNNTGSSPTASNNTVPTSIVKPTNEPNEVNPVPPDDPVMEATSNSESVLEPADDCTSIVASIVEWLIDKAVGPGEKESNVSKDQEKGKLEGDGAGKGGQLVLIPISGPPPPSKPPPRKKRRNPPKQLIIMPTMSMVEALTALNYNLKISLVIGYQDTSQTLRHLRDIIDLAFSATDIEQVKDLVYTLRKLRRFKHNSRIRNKAEELYSKIKSFYVIGEVRPNPKFNGSHKPQTVIRRINEAAARMNGDCSPPPMDVTTVELNNNDDANEPIEEEVNQNVRRSQRSRTRVNYSELSGIAPVKKEEEDDDQEVPSG